MRWQKGDRGEALPLVALTAITPCRLARLDIDAGFLRDRQHRQPAANSTAPGGASELYHGDVIFTALEKAAKNGLISLPAIVNNPPHCNPRTDHPDHAEVQVALRQWAFPLRVFGFDSEKADPRAVVYSKNTGASANTINLTGSSRLLVSGTRNMASQCGLVDDFDNSSAAPVTNGGGCISPASIGVVGDFKNNSTCTPTLASVTAIARFSDPLANSQPPAVGSCAQGRCGDERAPVAMHEILGQLVESCLSGAVSQQRICIKKRRGIMKGKDQVQRIRRKRENDCGAALLEFATVIIVFVMFVFGVMDFGRALHTYHFVNDAAHEATQYAMVQGSASPGPVTASEITDFVKAITPHDINPKDVTVNTTWTSDNAPGSELRVQVSDNFRFTTPVLLKYTMTLTGTSQAVISY